MARGREGRWVHVPWSTRSLSASHNRGFVLLDLRPAIPGVAFLAPALASSSDTALFRDGSTPLELKKKKKSIQNKNKNKEFF